MKKLLLAAVILLSLTVTSFAGDKSKIIAAGNNFGIPTSVISYVANKESTFRCSPNNPKYFGPLQISYPSAKELGYKGKRNGLNNCGDGLKYGLRHLKLCYNKIGNKPKAVADCHARPAKYGVVVRWKKKQ